MKIKLFLLSLLFVSGLQAQVTIGSNTKPNFGSLLDLKELNAIGVNSTKGLGLPRVLLNTANDLAPAISESTPAQRLEHAGLIVYHIGNVNLCAGPYVWDTYKWQRLPEPCRIAIQCATVQVNGAYNAEVALNASNTISLTIDVPSSSVGGTYHIYTDTQNGMSFSGTGVLTAGAMNIVLAGSGKPINAGVATTFTIKADYSNNTISSFNCSATLTPGSAPVITMDCGSLQVKGTYTVGTALSSVRGNMISVSINVPAELVGGTYTIATDTQNGMSFATSGILVGGTMNIDVPGSGAPKSGGSTTTFTLVVTSTKDSYVSSVVCTATLTPDMIPLAKVNILGFGYFTGTYGYFLDSSASKAMVTSTNNFGSLPTSVVKTDGIAIKTITGVDLLNTANFLTAANGLNTNPDIIINGFQSHIEEIYPESKAVADALVTYIKTGGVAILFDEYKGDNNITVRILKQLFPANAANITGLDVTGSLGVAYPLANIAGYDDILDGPFSVSDWTNKTKLELRGQYWGNDASNATEIMGLPEDQIIVYSRGTSGGATMFRLKNYNLFYVGDGGFMSSNGISNTDKASTSICPFLIDASYHPVPRPGFGTKTVYNSYIFGNVMNWALKNARSNKK